MFKLNLVIDIGNTSTKIALFKGKRIIDKCQLTNCNLDNINTFLNKRKIDKSIIASVKKSNHEINLVKQHFNPLLINSNTNFPIKIKYKTPETLGDDRVAALVGAVVKYPGKNLLVFDAGTCLTFDYINHNKEYEGGRISPGLSMRYKSLNNYTDKLNLYNITDSLAFIGVDTKSSIISGVQQGILAEVNDIINYYMGKNNETEVVFTGGDINFFENMLKISIFAHPNLVLEGLNEILEINV